MRRRLRDLPEIAWRHAGWFVRDRFPDRKVVRDVQGVRLTLPWSHRLPDYAHHGPLYGQNLVHLAARLADAGPLTVLDVGANVGDSTAQILNAADGRVLCIEADPAYVEYLRLNVGADPRVDIVEGLLVTDPDRASAATPVRSGGTTRFAEGDEASAMPAVTPEELRASHPDFGVLRLVKSDTDGYDVAIVPAVARAWQEQPPVLFFEYDHHLTRLAGFEPLDLWPELADLGYLAVGVWDNGGRPLGRTTVTEIGAVAPVLDVPVSRRAQHYWDVAVVHESDEVALRVLEDLVPGPLDNPPTTA